MNAPNTLKDLERPLRDRERGIVLNRNRRFQRRITPGQAGANAGSLARGAARTGTPRAAPGQAAVRRAPRVTAPRRAGLLSRARGAVNNVRANILRARADRNAARAARLRRG